MKLICDEVYWCKESVHIEQSFIEENLHLDFIFKNKSNKLFVKKRPNIWPEQQNYCSSFTQFWKRASKDGNKQYSLFV